ncbi:MAG: M48 family metallopeptidase [Ruthenibacterium lactatiformans]
MKNKEPAQYRAAGGVRYEFKRKRVKNINLRVRADGSVAVSAPLGAPLAQVDAFVAGRARWIEAARVRALARGEEEQRPCSVSREDALALFTQVSDAVFPLFAQVLNVQRPVLKVRQMKTRWGVCVLAKRQITFSLRLAEKPRAAVEYVVLHEYAHFVRADHSPAFWAVVARYMPDYKARRRLLAPSVQGGMESPEGPPPTY